MQHTHRERLESLDGLKAVALILVFLSHISCPGFTHDERARATDFFFLASGFLVAYNAYGKQIPCTWGQSFTNLYRKYRSFFPIHLLTFLMVAIFVTGFTFDLDTLFTAGLNLTLQQSWSPFSEVFFSFNGVSWYLSSALFCFFMAPVLLQLTKDIRLSSIAFLIVFAARLAVEYMVMTRPEQFFIIEFHTFPPIRCMDFSLGLLMVPWAEAIRKKLDSNTHSTAVFLLFTILEVLSLGAAVILILKGHIWLRATFILLLCPVVFIYSFGKGAVGRFLTWRPLQLFSLIQLEFFMFHVPVIWIWDKYIHYEFPSWVIPIVSCFLITLLLSVLYYRTEKNVKKRLRKVD